MYVGLARRKEKRSITAFGGLGCWVRWDIWAFERVDFLEDMLVVAYGRVSDPMAKCKILGLGWDGMSVVTFIAHEHMFDATQKLGAGVGWDWM